MRARSLSVALLCACSHATRVGAGGACSDATRVSRRVWCLTAAAAAVTRQPEAALAEPKPISFQSDDGAFGFRAPGTWKLIAHCSPSGRNQCSPPDRRTSVLAYRSGGEAALEANVDLGAFGYRLSDFGTLPEVAHGLLASMPASAKLAEARADRSESTFLPSSLPRGGRQRAHGQAQCAAEPPVLAPSASQCSPVASPARGARGDRRKLPGLSCQLNARRAPPSRLRRPHTCRPHTRRRHRFARGVR